MWRAIAEFLASFLRWASTPPQSASTTHLSGPAEALGRINRLDHHRNQQWKCSAARSMAKPVQMQDIAAA
jgi:hypothetical protein